MTRLIMIGLLLTGIFVPAYAAGSSNEPPAPKSESANPPAAPGQGQGEQEETSIIDMVSWVKGPAKSDLQDFAEVEIPIGYMMTGSKGTQELLEAMGNPTSGTELGFLAPTNLNWFVIFRFNDVGYVKDDDKDKLNPDDLLKSIRAGTEEANKIRAKMGAAPMKIIGWEQPPKYNAETHNLEWAIRGESEGEPVINYNTRVLGRKGVMEVKLVIDPDKLTETLPVYQGLLKGYRYKPGQTYAEYRDGDKLAQYGLAALITGGAAAVALKTGLLGTIILFFKKGFKLIIAAVVGVALFVRKLVMGKSRSEVS